MAKNDTDPKTPATPTTTEDPKARKRNRGKGKAIVARMENVDGKSGVLLASSKKRAISTSLHWNMGAKGDEAFIMTIGLPDGKGGEVLQFVYMGKAQAQAVYEGHPRRVEATTLPPACPLAVVATK